MYITKNLEDPTAKEEVEKVSYSEQEEKVYTPQDLFAHINAVENELKTELNEIKKVLNKLITDKLNVQDGEK